MTLLTIERKRYRYNGTGYGCPAIFTESNFDFRVDGWDVFSLHHEAMTFFPKSSEKQLRYLVMELTEEYSYKVMDLENRR